MQARTNYLLLEDRLEIKVENSLNIQQSPPPTLSIFQRGTRYICEALGYYKGLSSKQIAAQTLFSLIGGHDFYSQALNIFSRITDNWLGMQEDNADIIKQTGATLFGILAFILSMRAIGYSFKYSAQFAALAEQLGERIKQLEKLLKDYVNLKDQPQNLKKQEVEMMTIEPSEGESSLRM